MGRVGARERLGGLAAVASLNFNHYSKALVSVAAKLGVRVSTYGFWDVIQSIAYGTIPFIRHPWELHFVRRISSCWGWGTEGDLDIIITSIGKILWWGDSRVSISELLIGIHTREAASQRSSVPQKAHTHVGSHVPLLYMLNNTWPVGKAGENSTRPPCNIVVTCVCKNVCEGEQARACLISFRQGLFTDSAAHNPVQPGSPASSQIHLSPPPRQWGHPNRGNSWLFLHECWAFGFACTSQLSSPVTYFEYVIIPKMKKKLVRNLKKNQFLAKK